jgi:hypothetical protein
VSHEFKSHGKKKKRGSRHKENVMNVNVDNEGRKEGKKEKKLRIFTCHEPPNILPSDLNS